MKILKNGWVCRIAYGLCEGGPPMHVSLCALVPRFICMCFVHFALVAVESIVAVVGFFFAVRPTIFEDDDQRKWYAPITR